MSVCTEWGPSNEQFNGDNAPDGFHDLIDLSDPDVAAGGRGRVELAEPLNLFERSVEPDPDLRKWGWVDC